MALVRTLADTRDTLALGALLRGPLVGLTEQELLDITQSLPSSDGGHEFVGLSLRSDPATIQHEVAREVLTILRDLHRRVHGTTPALLLAEAIERLRVRAIVMARSADQAVRSLANIDGLLERARSLRRAWLRSVRQRHRRRMVERRRTCGRHGRGRRPIHRNSDGSLLEGPRVARRHPDKPSVDAAPGREVRLSAKR